MNRPTQRQTCPSCLLSFVFCIHCQFSGRTLTAPTNFIHFSHTVAAYGVIVSCLCFGTSSGSLAGEYCSPSCCLLTFSGPWPTSYKETRTPSGLPKAADVGSREEKRGMTNASENGTRKAVLRYLYDDIHQTSDQ